MFPSSSNWPSMSQMEILITRACNPSHHEPNYALLLEVAEYINKKKANTYAFLIFCVLHIDI